MTPDQVRELEHRLQARGLSRKARREAVTCFREWIAEQSPPDADPEAALQVLEAAHALIRRIEAVK